VPGAVLEAAPPPRGGESSRRARAYQRKPYFARAYQNAPLKPNGVYWL
jgi:hypothetical protein